MNKQISGHSLELFEFKHIIKVYCCPCERFLNVLNIQGRAIFALARRFLSQCEPAWAHIGPMGSMILLILVADFVGLGFVLGLTLMLFCMAGVFRRLVARAPEPRAGS